MNETILCECGCGKKFISVDKRGHRRHFVRGHASRIKIGTALCGCGCGEEFAPFDERGRPRKFIYGHWSRVQPVLATEYPCTECGAQVVRQPWQIKQFPMPFCNLACQGKYMARTGKYRGKNNGHYNTISVPCSGECGETITKAVSLIQRRNNRVYCPTCARKFCRVGRPGFYVGYPKAFSPALRTRIRKRDNHTCQECGSSQAEAGTLHVYHIDYDKANNSPSNLIALCNVCHGSTNYAPEKWQARYQGVIAARQ